MKGSCPPAPGAQQRTWESQALMEMPGTETTLQREKRHDKGLMPFCPPVPGAWPSPSCLHHCWGLSGALGESGETESHRGPGAGIGSSKTGGPCVNRGGSLMLSITPAVLCVCARACVRGSDTRQATLSPRACAGWVGHQLARGLWSGSRRGPHPQSGGQPPPRPKRKAWVGRKVGCKVCFCEES